MPDLFEGWEGFDVQEERRVGYDMRLIDLVCKKMIKGIDAESIAEAVEEPLDYVKSIIAVAKKYAPDYDAESIRLELDRVSNFVK